MQTVNTTRKAALSFLSSLSIQDASPNSPKKSSLDSSPNKPKTASFIEDNDSANFEETGPQLEVPPDPDLEDSIQLQNSPSTSKLSSNTAHKQLKSKKDRAAAKFLSNLSVNAPATSNENIEVTVFKSPIPIAETAEDGFGLSFPRRCSTEPSTSKNFRLDSYGNQNSSSSSDSSSEDEPNDGARLGSFTDEEAPLFLSASRKSSYLVDAANSRDPSATQAMTFDHVFAKKSPRRSRTKKKLSRALSLSKKDTDSYAYLLSPKLTLIPEPTSEYNPMLLDDPAITLEAKNTGFSSIMDSLIYFAKSGDNFNEPVGSFIEKHPSVDNTLNLSLIRSLKSKLLTIAQQLDLELASLAHAFVYFEKLCLKGLINKDNRKVQGAACLFLAIKVNEHKSKLEGFMEAVDRILDVGEKELRGIEFATFADLEFNLLLPKAEFLPHLERILADVGCATIENYVEGKSFYMYLPDHMM